MSAGRLSHAGDRASWIEPSAKNGSLVYISDAYENRVYMYSYPKLTLAGALTGFNSPEGECVDARNDVWITDNESSQIVEYAHGSTTPKAILRDPNKYPYACAIDPSSGDLAVVNFAQNSIPGGLSIYKKAKGLPRVYTDDSLAIPFFDAYGAGGILFVDGIRGLYYPYFTLVRFRNGRFANIELNQAIDAPGGIAIAGTRVNVGDSFRNTQAVYGFAIAGSKGQLIGTTHLLGTYVVEEFAIDGTSLIATNTYETQGWGEVFAYPAGGSPKRTFGGKQLEAPVGLVVSK